jgi:hypothetical protein
MTDIRQTTFDLEARIVQFGVFNKPKLSRKAPQKRTMADDRPGLVL